MADRPLFGIAPEDTIFIGYYFFIVCYVRWPTPGGLRIGRHHHETGGATAVLQGFAGALLVFPVTG